MSSSPYQDRRLIALEPNPAEGRGINSGYLTELSNYHLDESRWGRRPGLLPVALHHGAGLPVLSAPDQVSLPGIFAIGENGYAIVSWPDAVAPRIKPLDLRSLPPGEHTLYVCLAGERTPCGEALPTRAPNGAGARRVPRYRAARVVLATEAQRTEHLDWLPITRVVRERGAASVRTRIDPRFHPPVSDLEAWTLPNPLVTLVERGLQALDGEDDSALHTLARLELIALRNVARRGDPQVAFVQAQRSIALLRAAHLRHLILPGEIENAEYDPAGLWSFFAILEEALSDQSSRDPLPTQVRIDGVAYQRLPGECLRDEAVWRWDAPRAGFHVNGLAVYFPYATRGELPVVKCGRLLHDANGFPPATEASGLEAPGTALLLPQITHAVDRVYLTVLSPAEGVRLEQKLNQGHGLYYF